jgi:Ni/Co efflux regulator RcnB
MKRTMIGAALAASLLTGTSALAQHDDHDRRGGDGGGRNAPPASQAAPQAAPSRAVSPPAPVNRALATPERGYGGEQHFGHAPSGQGGMTPQFQGRAHGDRGDRGGGGQAFDRHDFGARGDESRGDNRGNDWRGDRGEGGPRRDFGSGGDNRGHDWRGDRGDGGPRHDFGPGGDNRGNDWRGDRGEGRPRYDERAFPRSFRPDHAYRWRGEEWREPRGFYNRHWGYGDRLPWGWIGPQWYIEDYYDYDLPVPPWGYEWIRVGPVALLIDLSTGMVVEAAYGLFYY